MRAATRILILFLAAGAWWLGFWTATTQSSPASAGDLRTDGGEAQAAPGGSDPAESGAVCPVVYQLDQSPSSRGYHYQFFGNAFFINERGYLLTDEHVLETFRDGGQPYILVNRRESPPQLLAANIVAVDKAHDVAILRAETNPFGRPFRVAFLTLSAEPAVAGETVMALSLHPARPGNAQSFQAEREDRSLGRILSFESTRLEKSAEPAMIFLLSHAVELGQSGSPVLAVGSSASGGESFGAVVGMIEGRWLRGSAAGETGRSSPTHRDVPGAALPIAYAIDLLEREKITWHASTAEQYARTHR